MKKTKVLALALVVLMLVAGCSSAATTIRVGHVLAPTHPYQLGLEKFSELASEKTNGNVKVEVFHSSQLGNERDLIEGLQLGSVEMCIVSTAPLSGFTTQFGVFDLPFIFSETNKTREILDGPIGQGILDSLSAQGIVGLCYFENGFRNITNNVRPITKPEDLQGLKIRTMESPIHMASFRAMGTNPTPMALGELFTALQQGTVDGQENPLAIINTSKFYEVQKYLSITEHFYAPAPLLIGKSFFDRLDADVQKALNDAAIEARAYERGLLDDMNTKLREELQKAGMEINTVDKQLFINAVQPVYAEYEGEIGKELIKQVQDAQK
ncbi:MAG: TRAP transporter substrate-binding protein [Synergistaceae bacterium]|nr:TRAP transporter substrate-binding protein [Synergistaceae bacterium]